MRRQEVPPVQIGDERDVTIEAVGEKGDGIAKVSGFVLFIPNTKKGQRVRIKITKVLQSVGFAEAIGEAKSPEQAPEIVVSQSEIQKEPEPEDSEDFGEDLEEEGQ